MARIGPQRQRKQTNKMSLPQIFNIKPLKSKTNLKRIKRIRSYRAVNTLALGYKTQYGKQYIGVTLRTIQKYRM